MFGRTFGSGAPALRRSAFSLHSPHHTSRHTSTLLSSRVHSRFIAFDGFSRPIALHGTLYRDDCPIPMRRPCAPVHSMGSFDLNFSLVTNHRSGYSSTRLYSTTTASPGDPPVKRGRGRPKGSKNKKKRSSSSGSTPAVSRKLSEKHRVAWEQAGGEVHHFKKDTSKSATPSTKKEQRGKARGSKQRSKKNDGKKSFEQFVVDKLNPEQLEQYKFLIRKRQQRMKMAEKVELEAEEFQRKMKEEVRRNPTPANPPPPLTIKVVVEKLKENKANSLVVLDVRDCCPFVQYIVICEGNSTRHMRALADDLLDELRFRRRELSASRPLTVEGRENQDWMLVDCGDIVLNVMSRRARLYYDLESLWALKSVGGGSASDTPSWEIEEEEGEEIPNMSDWHPLDNDNRHARQ